LVAEGLQLYRSGALGSALEKWHAALVLEPGNASAEEYIDYVEANRGALDQRFKALKDGAKLDRSDRSAGENASESVAHEPVPKVTQGAISGVFPKSVSAAVQADLDPLEQVRQLFSAKGQGFGAVAGIPPAAADPVQEFIHNMPTSAGVGPRGISEPIDDLRLRWRGSQSLPPLEEVGSAEADGHAVEADGDQAVGETTDNRLLGSDLALNDSSPSGNPFRGDDATPAVGDDQVESMLAGARQMHDRESFDASLWFCERVLSLQPDHLVASDLRQRNRLALQTEYEERLSDLRHVPVVQVPQHEVVWHRLDHRAGFLLSRIDGQMTYADILDISGMDRFETLRLLIQLLDEGVVS
jgi:hypothetical protein